MKQGDNIIPSNVEKSTMEVDEEREKYLQSIMESEKQRKEIFKFIKRVELMIFTIFLGFLLILVIYSFF